MNRRSETAATTFRVLDKFSDELTLDGPWHWRCAVRNGTRLTFDASLREGFLLLTHSPGTMLKSVCAPARDLVRNNTLAGGVRVALGGSNGCLHLRTDILVLEEKQLMDRLAWALDGFHGSFHLLNPLDSLNGHMVAQTGSGVCLGELMRGISWPYMERGPNDFSVDLDTDAALQASIRMVEGSLVLSVDLVRCSATAEVTRQALAVFLLMTTSALRLVRVCAEQTGEQECFRLEVSLPAAPASEEIDHALAALSITYRVCAREANLLLDHRAARCYLAACDFPTTRPRDEEKEK